MAARRVATSTSARTVTEPTNKIELFAAVTVEEALERGANINYSRGDLHECSYSGGEV